jgi:hypothetical protein
MGVSIFLRPLITFPVHALHLVIVNHIFEGDVVDMLCIRERVMEKRGYWLGEREPTSSTSVGKDVEDHDDGRGQKREAELDRELGEP